MIAPSSSTFLVALAALCLAGCGGDEQQPQPQPGRIDVNVDSRECRPSCPIARYSFFVTPEGSYSCSLAEGTGAPGREAVIGGFTPPESGRVGLLIVGSCADGCLRCFGFAQEVEIREGQTPQSLPLASLPGLPCVKLPFSIPWGGVTVSLPPPRC